MPTTLDDVRRIALSLAGAFESHDGYGFVDPSQFRRTDLNCESTPSAKR
jgi:hypothetical protein